MDSHGVAVIDAQNNGNPATFAALARALGIPWLAVFDGDGAGKGFVQAIAKRGFGEAEIETRCATHPDGDLEAQLVADGLDTALRDVLTDLDVADAGDLTTDTLLQRVRDRKVPCAAGLAARFRRDPGLARRAPVAFREVIEKLPGLT